MNHRLIAALFALISLIGLSASHPRADVTGHYGIDLTLEPVSTDEERSLLRVDLENDITLAVKFGVSVASVHSHFGLAGVEDVITTFSTTFAQYVDLESQVVFGRFGPEDGIPDGDLRFVRKRTVVDVDFLGVNFQNLALVEDANFPDSPAIGFGDKFTVQGRTNGNIRVGAATGICILAISKKLIKKHKWPFTVNPGCALGSSSAGKPPLLFDFENAWFQNIPLATDVTADVAIGCEKGKPCRLENTVAVSGGPIPLKATVEVANPLNPSFQGATATVQTGLGALTAKIATDFTLAKLKARTTLNLKGAKLKVKAVLVPGSGLSKVDLDFLAGTSDLNFSAKADFSGGPPARFSKVTFGLKSSAGSIGVGSSIQFGRTEMAKTELTFKVGF